MATIAKTLRPTLNAWTGAAEEEDRARVLVVDDDERNLLAITTVIEDLADVVVARSGEEALRHLLKGDFAVILLDVYMPGMDGYEAAQIIRAREQTKRIPIVFLSAVNKETEHLMRGYSMGAVDYVFKPVEAVVIRSKVSVFVDLFTMRREIQRKAAYEQQLLDDNLRANGELLRAEQELRLADQRQAAIIQSLPIVLYLEGLTDLPRVPRFVSGNFASVTGFEHAELQRSPDLWVERLHPEDRDRVVTALSARRTGGSLSVEYRWRCANGEYRHFCDQAVLLLDAAGEPFFTTKEVGKGTGLGLSMVYGFAQQSGGAMRIDSSVGAGTRIELWLPMVSADDALLAVTVEDQQPETVPASSLRVLLVDDHAGIRATTAALLEDLGHHVVQADGGEAGLGALTGAEHPFDVLVTDYAMPHQSGVELIERARLVAARLPGVIITGYADASAIARRPQDVAVLGKPFTAHELGAALSCATQGRSEPLDCVRPVDTPEY